MKLKLFIAIIFSTSMSSYATEAVDKTQFSFEDLKALAKASAEKPYTETVSYTHLTLPTSDLV